MSHIAILSKAMNVWLPTVLRDSFKIIVIFILCLFYIFMTGGCTLAMRYVCHPVVSLNDQHLDAHAHLCCFDPCKLLALMKWKVN